MAHVFISYSRQDIQIVDRLVRELEAAAVKVWIDREDIPGGARWRRQIVDAIQAADAVVVALSPSAAASDNVRKELNIAEDAKRPILPVEIRQTVIPRDMVWHLVDLQRIDLATSFDSGVKRLVQSIRALVGAPQAFVRLSPEARNEIKELMDNPGLSSADRLSLASVILMKDSARMRDKAVADLPQLNDRLLKRMELKDQLARMGGSSMQMHVLAMEQAEDETKRKLILDHIEQAGKIQELALSQLRAVLGAGEKAIKEI